MFFKSHATKFVQTIIVIDPDTHLRVELEVRKDVESGLLVGLDGAWLEQLDGDPSTHNPGSPYEEGVYLVVPDDEF